MEAIFKDEESTKNYSIELLEEEADRVRDLCGECLQHIGFDKNYDLTEEGEILESLIDKLYIG